MRLNSIKPFSFVSLLVIISLVVFTIYGYFNSNPLSDKKEILENPAISWGVGWDKTRSKYGGSEFRFQVEKTQMLTFAIYTPNKEYGQGINVFIGDEQYVIENPNVNKIEYKINIENPEKKNTIRVKHFCSGSYSPCDIEIKKIVVDKSAEISKSELPSKTLAIIGDSISVGWGRWNYSFLLTEQLNYQLHNASVFGSSVVRVDDNDVATNRYKRDIIEFKPSVIVIFLGTNDMAFKTPPDTFRDEYSEMVRRISSNLPESKIVLLGLLKRQNYSQIESNAYSEVIEDIASKYNVLYVDMYEALEFEDLQDGVHPELSSQRKLATFIQSRIKDYIQ